MPLAATIFRHASEYSDPVQPPIYANGACRRLLREGLENAQEEHELKEDEITSCMTAAVEEHLRTWLTDGADNHQPPSPSSSHPPANSSSSSTPSPPSEKRPPPRVLAIKLHDRISFPPVLFSASVHKEFTVLTQRPPQEMARETRVSFSASNEGQRKTETIREIEVDADKAADATSVEGMALSYWQVGGGIFRTDRQFRPLTVRRDLRLLFVDVLTFSFSGQPKMA
jgi:hypothetical protein